MGRALFVVGVAPKNLRVYGGGRGFLGLGGNKNPRTGWRKGLSCILYGLATLPPCDGLPSTLICADAHLRRTPLRKQGSATIRSCREMSRISTNEWVGTPRGWDGGIF